MQTPIFILLFLAPVYVPLHLLQGWIHGVARFNPITYILVAGPQLHRRPATRHRARVRDHRADGRGPRAVGPTRTEARRADRLARARRGGGSPPPTGGCPRASTPASCGPGCPGRRACRGTARAGRPRPARSPRRARFSRRTFGSASGQPLFHGRTFAIATRRPSALPRRTRSRRLSAAGSIGRPLKMSLIPPWTMSASAPCTASSKRAAISAVVWLWIPWLRNSKPGCFSAAKCCQLVSPGLPSVIESPSVATITARVRARTRPRGARCASPRAPARAS